jgi:Ala-tRNA(Pro) deacylase
MSSPVTDTEKALFALFDKVGITHETREHEAIFTVEEGQDIKADMPGGHTKNLFLKDKSGQYVLISALASTPIRLNQCHKVLGTKRLSFGKESALFDLLGVRPGSVTLFSVINDVKGEVRLVLDKALFDYERVWFHPLRNTASTAIYTSDIMAFAKNAGHEPTLVDFHALLETGR